MKLSDLSTVNHLVAIKAKCAQALLDLEQVECSIIEDGKDCGGMPGYEVGYSAFLHLFQDGSGQGVDMSGCYLAEQMATATRRILEAQIERCVQDLANLGVDFEWGKDKSTDDNRSPAYASSNDPDCP